MLTMNEDLEGALKGYLACLANESYFDAHEVLEEAWHPLRLKKDPLRHLVKGLINAAICFEHIKRNKKNSKDKATRVLASYMRYRELCIEGIVHYGLFNESIETIESLKIKHSV